MSTISKWELRERVQRTYRRIGVIMALSAEGRCVALGTVTFVQLGDRRALLTAAHVASGIAQRGGEIRLLHTRGKEIDDTRVFACDLDVLWRSDDLDVALLAPPLDLLRSADAEWFDLDRQRRLVQALRQVRHTFDSEDASLPYFAIGVPNFGRISFESFRVESLGIMPIPAYVSQLETDPWSGDAAIVPQMHLELDANELDPDFAPDDPFGAHAYGLSKAGGLSDVARCSGHGMVPRDGWCTVPSERGKALARWPLPVAGTTSSGAKP